MIIAIIDKATRSSIQPQYPKIVFVVTGVRVLSAETVPVRIYTGNQNSDPERTYTYNAGNRSEHYLYVMRLYLDGMYSEPPANVLPPLPVVQQSDSDCCAIL